MLRPVAEAVAMMGVTEAAVKTQTTRAAFSLADAMRHDTLSCDKSSNVHVMAAMRLSILKFHGRGFETGDN